jgi:hypothetical protein
VLSDTCVKDREKHDDARPVSRMNMVALDWFLLYYAMKFDATDELRAATYIIRRTAS